MGMRGYLLLPKASQKPNAIRHAPPSTIAQMTAADFQGYNPPPCFGQCKEPVEERSHTQEIPSKNMTRPAVHRNMPT